MTLFQNRSIMYLNFKSELKIQGGLNMSLFKKPDRFWRNNDTDGRRFSGYDGEDGKTTWYDSDGNLDSITDTPSDWEQEMNDEGF